MTNTAVNTEHIETVVADRAAQAFWREVFSQFPEVVGDMKSDISPDIVIPLEEAMVKAVQSWIQLNK